MRILDIFPYFNEKELLELRVKLLKDKIDQFIICDANRTQTGIPKDFTANKVIRELNLPLDKIKVIEVDLSIFDNIENNKNASWMREAYQRNIAVQFIEKDDVAFVSDCDEIVNPEYIESQVNLAVNNPNYIIRNIMIFLMCRADLQVYDDNGEFRKWIVPFICMKHHLVEYTLTELRISGEMHNDMGIVQNAYNSDAPTVGWHFSWMGDNANRINKYKSFADSNEIISNCVYDQFNQPVEKFIQNHIPQENSYDPLGRTDHILKKYDINLLPKLIFKLPNILNYLLPNVVDYKFLDSTLQKKKVLFHENQITERGTSVALYDYAYFAREILDVDPVIAFNNTSHLNVDTAISKFGKEFNVISYDDFSEVEKIIDLYKIDYFYDIKCNNKDDTIVSNAKNLIHLVFNYNFIQSPGNTYAVVSEWMSFVSDYTIPYVPHMLNLPVHDLSLRTELGIPQDAVVLGRYGGWTTFDIPFVNNLISICLNQREDLWFIFLNTPNIVKHERCIYLNLNCDLSYKTKFINTCDGMIHARFGGESFGLAILEFAANNKQIITFDNYVGERNHHLFLRNNCSVYLTPDELYNIFMNITKINPFNTEFLKDKFSPKNVMDKFNQVFLK